MLDRNVLFAEKKNLLFSWDLAVKLRSLDVCRMCRRLNVGHHLALPVACSKTSSHSPANRLYGIIDRSRSVDHDHDPCQLR